MSLTLSVIIPVRGGTNDLAQAVKAVLGSSMQPEEILIADDGSREPLPEILRHPLCRVLRIDAGRGSFYARNVAASEARGDVLVFLDSDVCVAPRTLAQLCGRLEEDEGLAAVFGKYDAEPAGRGLVSQYRNLLHAFMHQSSRPEARTFWTGCGAIRRAVFQKYGGFALDRRYIRDIELGVRLSQAGERIRLDRDIEVKHLKRWTLANVVRTDVFYRGANWTEICLRSGGLPNDMNTRMSERICVVLAYLLVLCLCLAVATWNPVFAGIAALVFAGYLFFSRAVLQFLWRAKGAAFALCSVPLHLLYHLCGGAGFLIGLARWLGRAL